MKVIVEMNEDEIARLNKWRDDHPCTLRENDVFPGKRYAGAVGGADTYYLTPTGIGDCVGVKCICGQRIDFTDFSGW